MKGELVMLNKTSIHAKHRCKKLKDKMYGPFPVIDTGSTGLYCMLRSPDCGKIHLIFNIALLETY
jgi:hypothetical protein